MNPAVAKKRAPFTPARSQTKPPPMSAPPSTSKETMEDPTDGRISSHSTSSSLASTSSGTSAALSTLPSAASNKFTPARHAPSNSTTPTALSPEPVRVKAALSEVSRTRGMNAHTRLNSIQAINALNNRPASSLGNNARGVSPSPRPGTPKRARPTYDSPSSSPNKPSHLSLHLSQEPEFSVDQLVDAEGITEHDLSAEFDIATVSRLLAEEKAKQNEMLGEGGDKVLVSIRSVSFPNPVRSMLTWSIE